MTTENDFRLSSERFDLRPIASADATPLHELWTEESVREFLWDGEAIPFEQTQGVIVESGRLFREERLGIWGIREREVDALVGFAGYWYFREPPVLELLFGVAADRQGQGIATEAARVLIRYAFEQLGLPTIEASTDVGNKASVRVLEKLGMSLTERRVADGLDTWFYSLTADS